MVTLSDLMSIGKILMDSGKIDLYQKLSTFSENLSQLQQENVELKNKIINLEDKLKIKEDLLFRDNAYWKKSDNDGPFCTRCWDKNNELIRMQNRNNVLYACPDCKNNFDGPDHDKLNKSNKNIATSYASGIDR
jgi:hypothetical protein